MALNRPSMRSNAGTYVRAAKDIISGNDRAMDTMMGAFRGMNRDNERFADMNERRHEKLRQTSQIMAEKLMRSGKF